MKKIQVLYIHGGMTFRSQEFYVRFLQERPISLESKIKWSDDWFDKALGNKFHVIRPRMPLQDAAHYADWKIHFERYLELLTGPYILVGNSLGGIFLAKYLSENTLKRKALATYLVCPPFDNTLTHEYLGGGFTLKKNLSWAAHNTKILRLFFSKDDRVVPVAHAEKYRAALRDADIVIYKSKGGHFQISTFPELVKIIKNDVK